MYIKIQKNPDGGHEYQDGGIMGEGWAVIPSYMELPESFPWVDIAVEEVSIPAIDNGEDIVRMQVVSMTPREIPIESESLVIPTTQENADSITELQLALAEVYEMMITGVYLND